MAAVNEDLYNWMLKTQGMPAAEWYRNNPKLPHTSNPHVNPGAAKWFPQASTGGTSNTYASVSPEFEEVSVVEPAPSNSDYFQQFLNSLDPQERADIETMSDLTAEDKARIGYNYAARQQLGNLTPAQKSQVNDLLTYDPEYGEYGGYTTKEDLGFSPSSVLYNRYQDAIKNIPLRYNDDYLQIGYRALYGTGPGGSDEGYQMVLANEADRQARAKAKEEIYTNPLSQLPYTSYSAAKEAGKSLEDYRASLAQIGIEIPLLQGEGGYFVRAATAEDPEVQQYGIYNVGRVDYRTARQNEAIQKNIELLKQQADQGIQDSQQFLDQYVVQGKEGSEAIVPPQEPKKGPRGEDFGEVAWNTPAIPQGPYTPVRNFGSKNKPFYAPSTVDTINNPGGARVIPLRLVEENQPVDVRVARASQQSDEQREKLTQQSEFDLSKEKQLASAKAAEAYRKSAATEDPFRAAARMG